VYLSLSRLRGGRTPDAGGRANPVKDALFVNHNSNCDSIKLCHHSTTVMMISPNLTPKDCQCVTIVTQTDSVITVVLTVSYQHSPLPEPSIMGNLWPHWRHCQVDAAMRPHCHAAVTHAIQQPLCRRPPDIPVGTVPES
jgi:hypothetical protein